MKLRLALLVLLTLLGAAPAEAHLGSSDVFFEGMAGPWQVRITIRVPQVVPGQAEILVQVQNPESATVTFVPLASGVAVSNAPPEEAAQPVRGETNLFDGQLWLMTVNAYSVNVRIRGKAGEGVVQVPIDSIARSQLPLPSWLGKILTVLGLVLFCGAILIIAAAAGESALLPDSLPGARERRKYRIAAAVTGVILVLALVGGRKWWNAEEKNFRTGMIEGGWPDVAGDVRVEGSQRVLHLTIGKQDLRPNEKLELTPDHGKLLHLYLVGQPALQAFCHIHPVREDDLKSFEATLPPLPEGEYEMLCDFTLSWGFSSTATNLIHLPPIPAAASVSTNAHPLAPDPDDSWVASADAAVRENASGDTLCSLPGGTQIIWKAHHPLRANQDAGLQFQVRDGAGNPAPLEPYMGMMSHAAVLRFDGRVFAHLHPSGNYSMAAQTYFEKKIAKEIGAPGSEIASVSSRLEEWCGPPPAEGGRSTISLPYEFPSPGDYRVWVQIKTGGQVKTAIFDTTVM
ncbi:MAG TPA: hypothetical protein VGO59_03435 [Verrucomicrobiae bacterium]|jgi:hypothetical protein